MDHHYMLPPGQDAMSQDSLSYGGLPYVPYGGGPTMLLVDNNPALDFHGYVLYATAKPIPDELMRDPTGDSIAEPGSILDEESGRTYANHETGRYFLPNDPAEQDRLDLQHQLCKVFLDGHLYRAPIAQPNNVLDIATGTGIWAIQFADAHPHANVIGTDISLIQPEGPHNCTWVKEDAENQDWTLPTLFDYVHMRLVLSCFDDHRVVIRKVFDQLEPGGWLEMMDPTFEILCTDGTSTGTHIERFCNMLLEAGNAVGRSFTVAKMYKQWLLEAGFVDVVEEVGPVPGELSSTLARGPRACYSAMLTLMQGNDWPTDPKFKAIGRWELANTHKASRGLCWKLFRNLGMSPEEIETFVTLVRSDAENTDLHYFFPM